MPIAPPVIHKGRFRAQIGNNGRPSFFRRRPHEYVDIFEDLTRSDAATAVRGFDQVITGLARMLATQPVDEGERRTELLRLDQETGAIDVPFCGRFGHDAFTLGGGKSKFVTTMLAEL